MPAEGTRATYDAIAPDYAAAFAGELAAKPLDRALLTAFPELVGSGVIGDVGCGPGHLTRFLAERHDPVVGVDLSPAMIEIARRLEPSLTFTVGSMVSLDVSDDAWGGIVAFYSIIHLPPAERALAFAEFARVLRASGWLLLAFHVDSAQFATGTVNHLTSWFGADVEIDSYFLDPEDIVADLGTAGFDVEARLERRAIPEVEYPSRRCYLLARRRG